jgi:FkbM family methyltransferase
MTAEEIMARLKDGPPGWFVEAGAHDGVGDSQTYALEQAGWRGLCVEPSRAFDGLWSARNCQLDERCLWKLNGAVTFREMRGDAVEMSGIPSCFQDSLDRDGKPFRTRMVNCVTLTTMLREHKAPAVIDFLCLDTEGSEPDILSAHDFSAYRFKLACVEYNGNKAKRAHVGEILDWQGGMFLILDDGVNVWWEAT